MERLNLDSSLLVPIKASLEIAIDRVIPDVLKKHKEAEINLKINISENLRHEFEKGIVTKEWVEPLVEFKLTEKLKENKNTREGTLGNNYEITLDEDDCKAYISKVNEQTSLFEEDKDE